MILGDERKRNNAAHVAQIGPQSELRCWEPKGGIIHSQYLQCLYTCGSGMSILYKLYVLLRTYTYSYSHSDGHSGVPRETAPSMELWSWFDDDWPVD